MRAVGKIPSYGLYDYVEHLNFVIMGIVYDMLVQSFKGSFICKESKLL